MDQAQAPQDEQQADTSQQTQAGASAGDGTGAQAAPPSAVDPATQAQPPADPPSAPTAPPTPAAVPAPDPALYGAPTREPAAPLELPPPPPPAPHAPPAPEDEAEFVAQEPAAPARTGNVVTVEDTLVAVGLMVNATDVLLEAIARQKRQVADNHEVLMFLQQVSVLIGDFRNGAINLEAGMPQSLRTAIESITLGR